MLGGRSQHNALIMVAIIASVLGAGALTIGMFMYYGCDYYPYGTCFFSCGGALLLLVGIGVGNYTKWRCQR